HRQICPPDIHRFRRNARRRPCGFARPERHHAGGQDRGRRRQAPRSWHLYMPGREQEAVMSALSITNPAPSERRLTGGILFLLAGLAALARPRRWVSLSLYPSYEDTKLRSALLDLGHDLGE